jgi:hypothetical protein
MTLREKVEQGAKNCAAAWSHNRGAVSVEASALFEWREYDRLLLALDTLEAVEWIFKHRIHVLVETPGVSRKATGGPDEQGWWMTDPDGEHEVVGATLSECVSKLRAAMKEGT